MKFKVVLDGYIIGVGTGSIGIAVGEQEYENISRILHSKPSDLKGYTNKLRADNLEWELVELPPDEPEPLTDEEALTRYANSITGADDPDLISAAETLITDRIKEGTV